MRTLSDTQQVRIMRAFAALSPRPCLEVANLDDLGIHGWFHLDHLRLLVAMLTACEQELTTEPHEK